MTKPVAPRRFLRDRSGAAGVEFAIIAPAMITLLFAMIEVNDLITANNRLHATVDAVADVTSRDVIVANTEIANTFAAAETIAFPSPAAALKVRVTSVKMTAAGSGVVQWSDARRMAPLTPNSNITLDPSIDSVCAGESIILAEAELSYTSPVGYVLGSSPMVLSDKSFRCPRAVDNVARAAS